MSKGPHYPDSSPKISGISKPNMGEPFISVSAPGKVILHGEHSVVYGKLALAASLDLRTKLEMTKAPYGDPQIVLFILKELPLVQSYNTQDLQTHLLDVPLPLINDATDISWEKPENLDHEKHLETVEKFVRTYATATNCELTTIETQSMTSILYLYSAILKCFKLDTEAFIVTVTTDLDIGAGLGSSASYMVTTVASLYQYARLKQNIDINTFDEEDLKIISKWAFLAEKIVHGTPSGIDNHICTYGSMVAFRKGGDISTIAHPKKLRILMINTKIPKFTKVQVEKVRLLKENNEAIVLPILESLEALSIKAVEYFKALRLAEESDNNEEVGEHYNYLGLLIDINQSLLRALGTSHRTIDMICSLLAEKNLHCKLTGAGGGGYCFSIIPPDFSENDLYTIETELKAQGFESAKAFLGGSGVMVHT